MCCKTKILRIRVTENQFIRLKNNVEAFGSKSISTYCRELLLNEPPSLLKLNSIENKLKKLEQKVK
ncbi:MAG: hypothetical protein ABIB47_02330 [Candidatus Woesearchaeota archaeon]